MSEKSLKRELSSVKRYRIHWNIQLSNKTDNTITCKLHGN